jgi:hypothetical protein
MDDEGLKLQGTSPIFDFPEHWLRRQALRSALSTVCNSKRLASHAGDPAGRPAGSALLPSRRFVQGLACCGERRVSLDPFIARLLRSTRNETLRRVRRTRRVEIGSVAPLRDGGRLSASATTAIVLDRPLSRASQRDTNEGRKAAHGRVATFTRRTLCNPQRSCKYSGPCPL